MEAHNYSSEEIEKAYRIAANVVKLHGDVYLPIFERLHSEMHKLKETSIIKTIALSVATK